MDTINNIINHHLTPIGLVATNEAINPPTANTLELILRVAGWLIAIAPAVKQLLSKKQKSSK